MCPVGSSGQTSRPGRPAHFTAAEAESPTGEWRFQVAQEETGTTGSGAHTFWGFSTT